ncbi:MAG: tripartite tricarboxylate transporter permease, partial [Spirochaetales bacterium]|nr:tripartite tricarboxylate transporter permease [Spirochaetales bacterium]
MNLETIFQTLLLVIAPKNLLFMVLGVFIGIVFGAIPGLSGGIAIIVLLPLTFSMDPMSGILMLLGIYNGGTYGGSIT